CAADGVVIDGGAPVFQVGDTFSFTPYAPDQIEESFSGGPAHGPVLDLRVVGRVRTVNQFLFTDGQLFLSRGLVDTYRDQILLPENADVVLRHGVDDLDALAETLDALVAPGTPILDLHESARRVETTTAVERTALFLLAASVAVAGL